MAWSSNGDCEGAEFFVEGFLGGKAAMDGWIGAFAWVVIEGVVAPLFAGGVKGVFGGIGE